MQVASNAGTAAEPRVKDEVMGARPNEEGVFRLLWIGQGTDKLKPRNYFMRGAARAGPHYAGSLGAIGQENIHNLARSDLTA